MSASILPVCLRDIRCRFGRKAVLRGVEVELAAGEIVGLLGRNGAGKTTLFSILVGLLQPESGERLFGARAVADVDLEIRAKLAWLAHDPQLYPLLSARENVELYVDLAEAPVRETPAAILTRLGLGEVVDRPVGTFSRGMAQRVALARALILEPELLILDEPFTALDRQGRALLADLLRAEAARGAAILLSSHDLDVVAGVVDRALLLARGVIAETLERGADEASGAFRERLAALSL